MPKVFDNPSAGKKLPGKPQEYHGVLLVDKPSGMTSHDVVDVVRRIFGQKAVGHAGTLDPLASGLLVLVLGHATKIVKYLMEDSKTYEAELHLGYTSSTYDAEGADVTLPQKAVEHITQQEIDNALRAFRGTINQKVPPHSAVHVNGRRLYERVRAGEDIEQPTREVTIHDMDVLSFDGDRLRVRVTCSKGTYIRSLAHDLGEKLGCSAYLASLRREVSGRFSVERAQTPDSLKELAESGSLSEYVLPIDQALSFSTISLSAEAAQRVRFGRVPLAGDVQDIHGSFDVGDTVFVKNGTDRVLAIGTTVLDSKSLHGAGEQPVITFNRVLR